MTGLSGTKKSIPDLLDAVYPSFALLAGMQLDLFTILANDPQDAETIAASLNVHPKKLAPLLYVLAAAELLQVTDGVFINAPEAEEFLVRGKPNDLSGITDLTAQNWERVLKTAEAIRNGGPLAEYDYHSGSKELEAILRGLYPATVRDAHLLEEMAV